MRTQLMGIAMILYGGLGTIAYRVTEDPSLFFVITGGTVTSIMSAVGMVFAVLGWKLSDKDKWL